MRSLSIAIALLITTCVPVLGQEDPGAGREVKKQYLYEWTDDKGTVHITDSPTKVPEPFRSRARKMESRASGEAGGSTQVQGEPSPPPSEEQEAAGKAGWQQRIKGWKTRLADAEMRYQSLQKERSELFRAWGSEAVAPIENRQRAEQIDQQMKEVQAEIDEARDMIDNIIPEEARKAGIPPGWLRE